jgi:hypothetical protein
MSIQKETKTIKQPKGYFRQRINERKRRRFEGFPNAVLFACFFVILHDVERKGGKVVVRK